MTLQWTGGAPFWPRCVTDGARLDANFLDVGAAAASRRVLLQGIAITVACAGRWAFAAAAAFTAAVKTIPAMSPSLNHVRRNALSISRTAVPAGGQFADNSHGPKRPSISDARRNLRQASESRVAFICRVITSNG